MNFLVTDLIFCKNPKALNYHHYKSQWKNPIGFLLRESGLCKLPDLQKYIITAALSVTSHGRDYLFDQSDCLTTVF